MNINTLDSKDLDRLVELYIKDRNSFYGLCSIENYCEQFCHKCDKCGRIVSILDMCEECDVKEEKNDFQYFELNKEKILYDL